uniref:BUD13 homolog n=1 Tax=Trichogramma kaykai TaxID=54128 RepID=A0ABD2X7D6_9HYME
MSKLQQDLKEMDKPLARYADDEDLEKELKSRDRDDDPMLAFIKEKEIKEGKRAPSYILAHLCPKGLVLNQVSNGMEWTEVMGMKTNGLNSKTRRKQLKKKLTSGVLQTCTAKTMLGPTHNRAYAWSSESTPTKIGLVEPRDGPIT